MGQLISIATTTMKLAIGEFASFCHRAKGAIFTITLAPLFLKATQKGRRKTCRRNFMGKSEKKETTTIKSLSAYKKTPADKR
jgi:hypothetical protein